jgi:hypothetical protein
MSTILPVKPVHSTWSEPVQFRARVQRYSNLPAELVVRAVDHEPENQRYLGAYHRGLPLTQSGQVIQMATARQRARRDPSVVRKPENIQRSLFRAKRRLKDAVKELAPTALLTLTSRNRLKDLDTAFVAWDALRRLIRQADPEFAGVVVPELHANGLHWHLHVAVRTCLGHKLLRRMWHIALCGLDGVRVTKTLRGAEAPGNVDLKYGSRGGDVARRASRIAKYIGKYLSKDLVTQFGRKSYAPTRNIKVAQAQRFYLVALTAEEARLEALQILGFSAEDALAVRFWTPDDKVAHAVLVGLPGTSASG